MDTASVLQAIYAAYREKRLEDVMSLLDDGFILVVHLPDPLVPGGDKPRNKAETGELLKYFMDTYDFLAYDPAPIIATEGRATAKPLVRFRDRKTGKILETRTSHTWRVDNGKATRLDEHHEVETIRAFLDAVAEQQK